MRIFAHKPEPSQHAKTAKSMKAGWGLSGQSRNGHSILHLQRTIGNQAVLRLLRFDTDDLKSSPVSNASNGFIHDFSRRPVHASARSNIQPKLKVNTPGDRYEQEADRVADQVLRQQMPIEQEEEHKVEIQAKPLPRAIKGDRDINENLESRLNRSKGRGNSLSDEVRGFFESRLVDDFSEVRVHTDSEATQMNQELGARSFTYGRDIYFGFDQYKPQSIDGKRLLAHELTHVLQQTGGSPTNNEGLDRPKTTNVPEVQRVVEMRPVRRHDAAWNRRQDLIDRLNVLSTAIEYRLDGRVLRYNVLNEDALTNFDRQMRNFIDRAEVVPMRLITSAGRVQGQLVLQDYFDLAYVDVDDLLASDDTSFQLTFLHILAERFAVRNYARRIGTNISDATFDRAHRAGLDAETELLREIFGDPSIRFIYEETRPNGTDVFGFRSIDENYWVFHVFRRGRQRIRGGTVFVQTTDRRQLTVRQFLAERAAAAAPAQP